MRLRYGMHHRDGRTAPVLTYRAATSVELPMQSVPITYTVGGGAKAVDPAGFELVRCRLSELALTVTPRSPDGLEEAAARRG